MTTPNLQLPELAASQAQPHLTVNSALRKLDAIVQLTARSRSETAPPVSPPASDGDCYIVAAPATGDWAGHEDEIAYYSGTAWEFAGPADGWSAWVVDEQRYVRYTSSSPVGWDTGIVSTSRTLGAAWASGSALVPASVEEVRAYCPFNGTIERVTIIGDGAVSGTCTIDVRRTTLAALPAVSGDSICSGVEPEITTGLY